MDGRNVRSSARSSSPRPAGVVTEPDCHLGGRLSPRTDETQVRADRRSLAKGEVECENVGSD